MSMSDCPKCWDTPCSCGHEYKGYSVDKNMSILRAVLAALLEQASASIVLRGELQGLLMSLIDKNGKG